MKKLEKTKKDIKYLNSIVSNKTQKVSVQMGFFDTQLASGFRIIDVIGFVYDIDLESGYCEWVNENGIEMPCVNINTITLLEDDELEDLSDIFGTVVALE